MEIKIYAIRNNYKGGAIIAETGDNAACLKFEDADLAESYVDFVKDAVNWAIDENAEFIGGEGDGGGIVYSDHTDAPILHCETAQQANDIAEFIAQVSAMHANNH